MELINLTISNTYTALMDILVHDRDPLSQLFKIPAPFTLGKIIAGKSDDGGRHVELFDKNNKVRLILNYDQSNRLVDWDMVHYTSEVTSHDA